MLTVKVVYYDSYRLLIRWRHLVADVINTAAMVEVRRNRKSNTVCRGEEVWDGWTS